MAKEAYYFSHDSNARHDPKITAMRGVYGSEGYGWWWMLIEMMREADGYKLDMKSKYAFNAYAMQLQCECNAIASFVHDCINEFNLFLSDGEHFWSESLLRRMEIRDEKSNKARESANARWQKDNKNANASDKNANAQKNDALKESKGNGKESKSKESDSKVYEPESENIPTTTDSVEKVFKAYCRIHDKPEHHAYGQFPLMERKIAEGFDPDLIIEVMEEKNNGKVNSFRYYEQALEERKLQSAKPVDTKTLTGEEWAKAAGFGGSG